MYGRTLKELNDKIDAMTNEGTAYQYPAPVQESALPVSEDIQAPVVTDTNASEQTVRKCDLTLGEWAAAWLTGFKPKVSENTRKMYELVIKTHLKPIF